MLRHLDNWLETHRRPFWEAIYLLNRRACEESLDRADSALERSPFENDDREALVVYLQFLRQQLRSHFSTDARDPQEQLRGEIVGSISAGRCELATLMQARCSLTLRCWAHALHGIVLPPAQVERWFAEIPEEDRDHQMMNYLSFWAFVTNSPDYLEQSYRYFLLQPVDFMVDFSRQRVKVLQATLRGDLERSDLLRLIELMPHRMHAEWFEKVLLPGLSARKLISPESEAAFASRKAELLAQTPQVPPRTQAPGKITLNF